MARTRPPRGSRRPAAGEARPVGHQNRFLFHTADRQVAETIVEHLQASDATMRAAQLRVLGGAMARVPAPATTFAHRDRRIMANLAAFYERPQYQPVRAAWVANFTATLRQGESGAYVGFLGDESPERVPTPTRVHLGPPAGDQAPPLRPSQPLPAQPEHPASDRGHPRTITDGARAPRACARSPARVHDGPVRW